MDTPDHAGLARQVVTLERALHRALAERDAARRSARLNRELLVEALNRTRGCPRCNPPEEDSDGPDA